MWRPFMGRVPHNGEDEVTVGRVLSTLRLRIASSGTSTRVTRESIAVAQKVSGVECGAWRSSHWTPLYSRWRLAIILFGLARHRTVLWPRAYLSTVWRVSEQYVRKRRPISANEQNRVRTRAGQQHFESAFKKYKCKWFPLPKYLSTNTFNLAQMYIPSTFKMYLSTISSTFELPGNFFTPIIKQVFNIKITY